MKTTKQKYLQMVFFLMVLNFFLKLLKPQKGLVKIISTFPGSKFLVCIFKCAFLNALFY